MINLKEKLEQYKDILKLQEWDIQLVEEERLNSDGSSYAVYNDFGATIKINSRLKDEEKEKTVIHELLHLVHRDESDIASENIENDVANKMYIRFHERNIERIAQVIYKLANPKALNFDFSVKDTESVKQILSNLADLIGQIEKGDYKDDLGHDLKMNVAYVKLKEEMSKEY